MPRIEHTTLMCGACFQESEHEVIYAGRLVSGFRCLSCGNEVRIDVLEEYLPDLTQRVVSKPERMIRRFRQHPVGFTLRLPRSILAKPRRVIEEVRTVMDSHAANRDTEKNWEKNTERRADRNDGDAR